MPGNRELLAQIAETLSYALGEMPTLKNSSDEAQKLRTRFKKVVVEHDMKPLHTETDFGSGEYAWKLVNPQRFSPDIPTRVISAVHSGAAVRVYDKRGLNGQVEHWQWITNPSSGASLDMLTIGSESGTVELSEEEIEDLIFLLEPLTDALISILYPRSQRKRS